MASHKEKIDELRRYIKCDPLLDREFLRATDEMLEDDKITPSKAQKRYRKIVDSAVRKTAGLIKGRSLYPDAVRERLSYYYVARLFEEEDMPKKNPTGTIERAGYERRTCAKYGKRGGKRKCVKQGPKTRVKATRVKDVGRPGKSKIRIPVKHPGTMGGSGFTDLSAEGRKKAVRSCVRKAGELSCSRKLRYLLLVGGYYTKRKADRNWSDARINKVASTYNWFLKEYDLDYKPAPLLK